MNKLISTKKSNLYVFGWSVRNWKSAAYLQLAKNWIISTKIREKLLFYQHSQPIYNVMQKEIKKLEFVQGVNFEFIDLLKNKGTKYLVIFDKSCENICSSKTFVDIATAGRHRGLSTIYIKNNLLHQSKLRRDVLLQNTYIVLFKSPRDVLQVTTLGAQLGLGSELVDWYRDATSNPFGHLLNELSPRTDDRFRYCTKTGSIPSNFYIPDRLKQSIILDDEHTKSPYSPSVPIIFPQMQKSFPSVLPKEFIRFVCECVINLLKGNLQTIKRHHLVKFQDEVWLLLLKRTTWKQGRNVLLSEKGLQLIAVITPPVTNHLSWYGSVCLVPASVYNKSVTRQSVTEQKLPKYKSEQPPTYQIDSLKRDINKKLFGKIDTLIDKILSCSRIKLSNSQTTNLDGVDTGV